MMPALPPTFVAVKRLLVTHEACAEGERRVAEETPVAFTYGRTTYAVMMATPADIEDFAIGFSLTEKIVADVGEIAEIEVVVHPEGVEARMTLTTNRDAELISRRRRLAGPVGCGLCGIESLDAAAAPPAPVTASLCVPSETVFRALRELRDHQALNAKTHAVHAAAFWSKDRFVAAREDVGRHNALDKLMGALARSQTSAETGFVVMSSRLSIELVQKAAARNCPMLVALSAPTALALRAAEACGMTVVAVARDDSLEVFTHGHRIEAEPAHVG